MVVGFTSVVGDLFHAGHVAMIQECKEYCDKLIVAVMVDTEDRQWKNRPVQSVFERMYQVFNCEGVDEVYACRNEDDLLLALKILGPFIDIRFVGGDYLGKDFTGREFCEESGIRIVYCKRYHELSTTELRRRISNGE